MASPVSTLLVTILISICANVVALVITNSMQCNFSREICTSSFCKISRPRGNTAYLSASCYMEKPLDILSMHAEVLQKVGKNYRSTGLKMVQKNICKFSNFQSGNPLLTSMMSLTSKHVKNLKCPMKGNVTVHKMPFMLHMAQGLLPNGDYLISIQLFREKLTVLNANISFTIKSGKFGV